jgi:glycylpeptide N-tetradecanoyltransferase
MPLTAEETLATGTSTSSTEAGPSSLLTQDNETDNVLKKFEQLGKDARAEEAEDDEEDDEADGEEGENGVTEGAVGSVGVEGIEGKKKKKKKKGKAGKAVQRLKWVL